MAPSPDARPDAVNTREQGNDNRGSDDHSSNDGDGSGHTIGPEGIYWRDACAALPPMTDEQIAGVGAIVRRIDQRRRG